MLNRIDLDTALKDGNYAFAIAIVNEINSEIDKLLQDQNQKQAIEIITHFFTTLRIPLPKNREKEEVKDYVNRINALQNCLHLILTILEKPKLCGPQEQNSIEEAGDYIADTINELKQCKRLLFGIEDFFKPNSVNVVIWYDGEKPRKVLGSINTDGHAALAVRLKKEVDGEIFDKTVYLSLYARKEIIETSIATPLLKFISLPGNDVKKATLLDFSDDLARYFSELDKLGYTRFDKVAIDNGLDIEKIFHWAKQQLASEPKYSTYADNCVAKALDGLKIGGACDYLNPGNIITPIALKNYATDLNEHIQAQQIHKPIKPFTYKQRLLQKIDYVESEFKRTVIDTDTTSRELPLVNLNLEPLRKEVELIDETTPYTEVELLSRKIINFFVTRDTNTNNVTVPLWQNVQPSVRSSINQTHLMSWRALLWNINNIDFSTIEIATIQQNDDENESLSDFITRAKNEIKIFVEDIEKGATNQKRAPFIYEGIEKLEKLIKQTASYMKKIKKAGDNLGLKQIEMFYGVLTGTLGQINGMIYFNPFITHDSNDLDNLFNRLQWLLQGTIRPYANIHKFLESLMHINIDSSKTVNSTSSEQDVTLNKPAGNEFFRYLRQPFPWKSHVVLALKLFLNGQVSYDLFISKLHKITSEIRDEHQRNALAIFIKSFEEQVAYDKQVYLPQPGLAVNKVSNVSKFHFILNADAASITNDDTTQFIDDVTTQLGDKPSLQSFKQSSQILIGKALDELNLTLKNDDFIKLCKRTIQTKDMTALENSLDQLKNESPLFNVFQAVYRGIKYFVESPAYSIHDVNRVHALLKSQISGLYQEQITSFYQIIKSALYTERVYEECHVTTLEIESKKLKAVFDEIAPRINSCLIYRNNLSHFEINGWQDGEVLKLLRMDTELLENFKQNDNSELLPIYALFELQEWLPSVPIEAIRMRDHNKLAEVKRRIVAKIAELEVQNEDDALKEYKQKILPHLRKMNQQIEAYQQNYPIDQNEIEIARTANQAAIESVPEISHPHQKAFSDYLKLSFETVFGQSGWAEFFGWPFGKEAGNQPIDQVTAIIEKIVYFSGGFLLAPIKNSLMLPFIAFDGLMSYATDKLKDWHDHTNNKILKGISYVLLGLCEFGHLLSKGFIEFTRTIITPIRAFEERWQKNKVLGLVSAIGSFVILGALAILCSPIVIPFLISSSPSSVGLISQIGGFILSKLSFSAATQVAAGPIAVNAATVGNAVLTSSTFSLTGLIKGLVHGVKQCFGGKTDSDEVTLINPSNEEAFVPPRRMSTSTSIVGLDGNWENIASEQSSTHQGTNISTSPKNNCSSLPSDSSERERKQVITNPPNSQREYRKY